MEIACDMLEELGALYLRGLSAYLTGGGERCLAEAYELGRTAAARGFGILDVLGMHHAALFALAPRGPSPEALASASQFLGESLSPFEMTHRGFREANETLILANRELSTKNQELELAAAVLREEKERADQANRELEAFSYSVSHDLRAPLRSIASFSQLLQGAAPPDQPEASDALRRIRAATERMNDMICDLLELSRVSRAELRRQKVDLSELARVVLAELARREPERTVHTTVEDGLVCEADRGLVRTLLENLLGNAWKFTARTPTARIELGARCEGDETVFCVRDNGAGFDMAYVDRLFTPFRRLHAESEYPGTGVGLATVRRIVERFRGRVWAEGAVGQGATLSFTIPQPAQDG